MITINNTIAINETELTFRFVRGSGPGGQNVNKVATAAQLRFNSDASPNLPDDVKERLRKQKRFYNKLGEIVIEAKRFRHQERNRQDAIDRLVKLIYAATVKPKVRKKTKPTKGSIESRIKQKKQRGDTKRMRQKPGDRD